MNVRVPWPAFVPVHDALRDAYDGVAVTDEGTVRFSTDSIHSSYLPMRLTKVCTDKEHSLFALAFSKGSVI